MIFSVLLFFILFPGVCLSATPVSEIATAVPKVPSFKASASSFYYDFYGRHPADGNIYGFEGVNYRVQALDLSYLYSPTLQFTLSAKHIRNYAETIFLGTLYKDKTQGMGDTKLKATKTFLDPAGILVADVAVSLPTGSVGEKNANNSALNYPYNMQLGSGTVDIEPSLVFIKPMGPHQLGWLGWASLRNGRNQYGYRRGNEYLTKVWYSYVINKFITPGVWINYHHLQRLSGQDSTYPRNQFVEFYHTPRHFWDATANVNAQYPISTIWTLKGLLAKPLWQESKNIDNVQVYMDFFAQLSVESTF